MVYLVSSSRSFKLKPISRGISSEWYTLLAAVDHLKWNQYLGVYRLSGIPCSFLIIVLSKIGQLDYLHVNKCSNVQNANEINIDEKMVFCPIHFNVSQRWQSFKWLSEFKWRDLRPIFEIEIEKNTAVLLANEHQNKQKKSDIRVSYTISLYNPSRKQDCVK